ncbi:hypothetical protein AB0D34_30780 [Streptomyces sp. NPDC048420]|uniref:hypothetical protein n=1 Tax=Streptomyces sp. NPDC048420 TaxID=3155755 RepID=UPI00341F2943
MRGLLRNDPDLLGRLAGSTDTARDDRHATMTHRYFELLTGHGLLRDDMSLDELAHAYQATFEGFLRAENPAFSPDQRAELLAQTTRRAFEHQQMPPDSTLHTIAAATAALLDELIAADRAEYGIPAP